MARLLVVDDERDVADMIAKALRQEGHQVTVTYTGGHALEAAQRERPDLVLLDIIMPQIDGFEICRRLRTDPSLSDVPIIFLTARGRIEDLLQGFEAGADDYVTKPFDLRELLTRIRAVLRRSQPAGAETPEKLTVGPLTLDCRSFEIAVNGDRKPLTPMEFDLLFHLMSHAGEVFSSQRLLQEVWGYPPGVGSPDLVRVHIRNLRLKIEPSPSNPVYIQTIGRHGYTLRPGPEETEDEAHGQGSASSELRWPLHYNEKVG